MGENGEGCTLGNPRTERGPAVISVNLTCRVWRNFGRWKMMMECITCLRFLWIFWEDRWSTKAQFCKHFADQKPSSPLTSDCHEFIRSSVCFIMVGFEPFPIRNSNNNSNNFGFKTYKPYKPFLNLHHFLILRLAKNDYLRGSLQAATATALPGLRLGWLWSFRA